MSITQAKGEEELRASITRIFRSLRASDPVAIRWETLPVSSSYRCLSVDAEDEQGRALRLFVKDFGAPLIHKPDIAERALREKFVYQELLNPHIDGPSRFLGYESSPSDGRCRLFLEFIEGSPVSHHHFPVWVEAAAWLGRMQTSVAETLARRGPGRLKIHGTRYFDLLLARAFDAVSAVDSSASRRLGPVIGLYPSLKSFFMGTPRTLVHGSYRAKQVFVRTRAERELICPLDWEIAGFGSHLYDLCLLADGYASPELDELVAAYNAEAKWLATSLPAVEDVRTAMLFAQLLRVLKWLAQWQERTYDAESVQLFLERAVGLSNECQTMVG